MEGGMAKCFVDKNNSRLLVLLASGIIFCSLSIKNRLEASSS
jgi:hypothetical protein